ncbi:hypothetical protein GALMADRAFT_138791 [Galerina marginata CBS 339.88]|uniref:Uncharacterized protein n=1 Tax=Galerina marginata (strain CBS 339.88) TaxID=685588 RepID=A0A067T3M0_GALM3|nr:hypothetical protein GALMADRAFT_138791 [Galerina marginata CBS 339.88]
MNRDVQEAALFTTRDLRRLVHQSSFLTRSQPRVTVASGANSCDVEPKGSGVPLDFNESLDLTLTIKRVLQSPNLAYRARHFYPLNAHTARITRRSQPRRVWRKCACPENLNASGTPKTPANLLAYATTKPSLTFNMPVNDIWKARAMQPSTIISLTITVRHGKSVNVIESFQQRTALPKSGAVDTPDSYLFSLSDARSFASSPNATSKNSHLCACAYSYFPAFFPVLKPNVRPYSSFRFSAWMGNLALKTPAHLPPRPVISGSEVQIDFRQMCSTDFPAPPPNKSSKVIELALDGGLSPADALPL